MKRRILIISVASLVALAIVGSILGLWYVLGGDKPSSTSQPNDSLTEIDEAGTPPLDPNEHGYFDSSLAKQMVIYNQQAVELANIVLQDAVNEDIKKIANEVLATHNNAADQYAAWLKEWDETYFDLSEFPRKDDHDAYPTNPGMPRVAELDKMITMPAVEKEKEFLRLSLQLHEGVLEYINMTESDIQYGEMKDYVATDKAHYSDEAEYIKSLQETKGY